MTPRKKKKASKPRKKPTPKKKPTTKPRKKVETKPTQPPKPGFWARRKARQKATKARRAKHVKTHCETHKPSIKAGGQTLHRSLQTSSKREQKAEVQHWQKKGYVVGVRSSKAHCQPHAVYISKHPVKK